MSEQINPSVEALLTGEQILAELRAERWHNAEELSSRAMSRAIAQLDRSNEPNVTPLDKNVGFFPYMTALSPAEAIALEGVGIDPVVLVPKSDQSEKAPANLEPSDVFTGTHEVKGEFAVGGAKLVVEQEPYETNTFSYRVVAENEADEASLRDGLHDRIGKAFADRPAYQKVHEVVGAAGENPDAISVKLHLNEDPKGVLSVLADAGLFRWSNAQIQQQILQGRLTVKDAIVEAVEERAQKDGIESGDFIRASYIDGVKHTIFLDKHTGEISLTLEQQPENYYVERANQWHEMSPAFIDTPYAKELFDLLAAEGLTVSKGVHHEMTRAGDAARFGSIYTQLTREVAKWVATPARTKTSRLVALQESRLGVQGEEPEDDQEGKLRDALGKIQTDGASEPVRVLLEMMQEAIARTSFTSDLNVTNEQVHISKSACFDVMTYYLGGATKQGIHAFEENGVHMLEKTYGGNTFLTLEPIMFNGVKLPKGALFSKADDEGWFFQRLTPFTFDAPADAAVFGSEVAKTKDIEKDSIAQLGGFSLARLVEHTT